MVRRLSVNNQASTDRIEIDDEEPVLNLKRTVGYDDEEEGGMPMDERAREEKRKERRRQQQELRRKTRAAHPELAGIDAKFVSTLQLHSCASLTGFSVHGLKYTMSLETDMNMIGL